MKPGQKFANITSWPKCIVPCCQNRYGFSKQAISFFSVPPTHNKVYKKWSSFLDLSGRRTEKICEEHFRNSDFTRFDRVKLRADAVPSLLIPAYCAEKIKFSYNGLCCVKGCVTRNRKNVARFPSKPNFLQKWKQVFGLNESVSTVKLLVCHRHFAKKDFYQASSKYLKNYAVPSLKLTHYVSSPEQDAAAHIADHNYICPPAEMPRGCFIPGCRTHKDYYERGVAMFSYPRDPKLLAAWNIACSRDPNFRPPNYACICEKHFNPSDVQEKFSGRCKLQIGAVPTRFLDGWKPGDSDAMLSSNDDFEDEKPLLTVDDELYSEEYCRQPPNVEEVFVTGGSTKPIDPEVEPIAADIFCRMCGIKHEKDNNYPLNEVRCERLADALLNVCLKEGEGLEAADAICPKCHHEVFTFLDFVEKCHEGQRRLAEQLSEQTQIPMPESAHDDEEDSDSDSSEGGDSEVKLSDGGDDDTEEIKNARRDRYIDKLITKLKAEGRRSRVSGKKWECLDCREVYQHRNHLAKHRQVCQLVGSEHSKRLGPFTCELCGKVLNSLPGYRFHLLKMHDREKPSNSDGGVADDEDPKELQMLKLNKVVACPLCTSAFRTAGELRYHLPSHKSTNQDTFRTSARDPVTGDPNKSDSRHMCSVCGKMERCNAALEIHMKFHLKQKDWPCDQCDKQYYTKADLKQHVMTTHEKIKYTCDDCGTVLNSRATFTRHKRLHNESLLKRCSQCPKKFTTVNALNKHVLSRHQGMQRPRLHAIKEPLEDTEESQVTDQEEQGEDRTSNAFEELIEETLMSEGSDIRETEEEFQEEDVYFFLDEDDKADEVAQDEGN